jgi:hypothetical protein
VSAPIVRYRSIAADSERWDHVPLRAGDIIVSTPAKCGTTWMQRILSLLILGTTELYEPMDLMSPWVDMLTAPIDRVAAHVGAQTHRRFLKSHTPLDGLPVDPAVTYVCVGRDLRDVGLSWDSHMENMNMLNFIVARNDAVGLDDIADLLAEGPPARTGSIEDRFWAWVDDESAVTEGFSLAATLHHLTTAWERRNEPNMILVRYEELEADLAGSMRSLAARLSVPVAEDQWPAFLAAASFDHMRARVADVTPESTKDLWLDPDAFFTRGSSGRWRGVLDAADVARYAARARSLAAPDLLAWVHEHAPLPE